MKSIFTKFQLILAASQLKNFPFMGMHATYSGSSYSVNIGPNQRIAKMIVEDFKKHMWIDRYTRALFIEANIYNANTNLMLIVTMLHEVQATQGWSYFYNIQSLRLYRYNGGVGSMIMLFDFIFTIVTIVNIYKAVKAIRREGCSKHISDPWNTLHIIVTSCSLAAIVFTIARALAVTWSVEEYKSDPEIFVSFAYVGQIEYFIMAFIGFVVFFTNLEFLRLLRFNKRIAMLTTTMKRCTAPLGSFGILFFVIFCAYVSFAHMIYVDKMEEFRKFGTSFTALVKMFLGKFDVYEYFNNAPTFGPLLFFSYMIIIQMIMINMFIGIVCDAFAEVREEQEENEYEILAFLDKKFKKMAGNKAGKHFTSKCC